jgi:hypothetical protein
VASGKKECWALLEEVILKEGTFYGLQLFHFLLNKKITTWWPGKTLP